MITAKDVRDCLREHVGVPDPLPAGVDADRVDFAELGYDSLAVLEASAVLGRRIGMAVPDDLVTGTRTPHQFAQQINALLAPA